MLNERRTDVTGSSPAFRMNLSNTNAGGWNSSYMRTVICNQFFSALPAAWQSVIGVCNKWTDNIGGATDASANVTQTQDKIWLMAEFEIFGARSYANSYEQYRQAKYQYYVNNSEPSARIRGADVATTGTNKKNAGDPVHWWERSPAYGYYCGHTNVWIIVKPDGKMLLALADDRQDWFRVLESHGFVPNFVIRAD